VCSSCTCLVVCVYGYVVCAGAGFKVVVIILLFCTLLICSNILYCLSSCTVTFVCVVCLCEGDRRGKGGRREIEIENADCARFGQPGSQ
jgi:hypothetical protein